MLYLLSRSLFREKINFVGIEFIYLFNFFLFLFFNPPWTSTIFPTFHVDCYCCKISNKFFEKLYFCIFFVSLSKRQNFAKFLARRINKKRNFICD